MAFYDMKKMFLSLVMATNIVLGVFADVPVPTGLEAGFSGTNADVPLTWNAVPEVDAYEVWRGTTDDRASAVCIASTEFTSFSDSNTTAGVTYRYWVRAAAGAQKSEFSEMVTGFRHPRPAQELHAWSDVSGVVISWTASPDATSYTVWRKDATNEANSCTVGVTESTSITDTNAAVGVEYLYWVGALVATPETGGALESCSDAVLGVFTGRSVPSVTDVVAKQRYPWNGLVDIDYTVMADDPNLDVYVMAYGEDRTTGENVNLRTLSGDGADAAVKPGRHRLTWNAKADASGLHSEDFVVRLTPFIGAAPYLVVELSKGVSGGNVPFRYSTRPPDLSDDTCRTTEMWFRLIPPGTFMMGSQPDEPNYDANRELLTQVTLTDPFYMAVFECTYKQWELVTGTNVTHTGDGRPVAFTVYNDLRGTNLGTLWPKSDAVDPDSFLGVFRERTRLKADLPTKAQWEYACRAGTTTMLNNGHNVTDLTNCPYASEVARYRGNLNDGKGGYSGSTTTVGMYKPNNWGLYDMHGNVSEWCRDWGWASKGTAIVNPVGPMEMPSNGHRIYRGGGLNPAYGLRAARWESVTADGYYANLEHQTYSGVRLVLPLPGSDVQ